jgi:cytochrome c biogenesis protein CcdA
VLADASLAFAFAAGLVAVANPCGFGMLPAYLAWFVGDLRARAGSPLGAALAIGAAVSAGFLVTFGVVGAIVAVGLRQAIGVIPWLALAVGVGVTALGVWLLSGREVTLALPGLARGPGGSGVRAAAGFGVSYGVASLSCTLPVFLSVVAAATTQPTVLGGVSVFLAYAAGMSLVLLALAVALAFGRTALLGRLRAATGAFQRVAGGLLVLAGGYVTLFWTANLLAGDGPATASGPVAVVESVAAALPTTLSAAPLAWGGVFVAVVLAGVVAAVLARRRRDAAPREPQTPRSG